MALTVGSLFSGIGGIDLGLESAGMVTRWFVEVDPYAAAVLRKHWPDRPIYGDINAVDWSRVEHVDILAGGFPCQPISSAGRQQAQNDARWLWPAFARAIGELRPRYVLVENVRNILAINGGDVFSAVLGDLAALGYDAEWDCIPASAVGAPHRRDRLWLVAYANSSGLEGLGTERGLAEGGPKVEAGGSGDVPDATSERPPGPRQPIFAVDSATGPAWEATQPLDGRLADQWVTEPDVGRVAHGIPARVDRLRVLGNAVVPQVAEWIGRRIIEADADA